MISTVRRLEYATGFIELGLLNEASEELELIEGEDRLSGEVMTVRGNLYMAAKNWDLLIAVSRELARQCPKIDQGWIHYAYALRELGRIAEAKAVLLQAEPLHAKCAALHYNMACYECLLGDIPEARRRLSVACKMGNEWKKAALTDPDLKAMWDDVAP
jgi:tetratricopeptide (TPR) repeat protein